MSELEAGATCTLDAALSNARFHRSRGVILEERNGLKAEYDVVFDIKFGSRLLAPEWRHFTPEKIEADSGRLDWRPEFEAELTFTVAAAS